MCQCSFEALVLCLQSISFVLLQKNRPGNEATVLYACSLHVRSCSFFALCVFLALLTRSHGRIPTTTWFTSNCYVVAVVPHPLQPAAAHPHTATPAPLWQLAPMLTFVERLLFLISVCGVGSQPNKWWF